MVEQLSLLPVRLRDLWLTADQKGISSDECAAIQERELKQFATIWKNALLLPGEDDIIHSSLLEIGRWRHIDDLTLIRRRCEAALHSVRRYWEEVVQSVEANAVEQYYNTADDYIEELMWWHTLADDNSPLAYVAALEFASLSGCRTYLDFGSGVGSGALLFRRHGFDVTLADISDVLLSFCKYRFDIRALDANFIDLKQAPRPTTKFDFITAMDVFEHLVDPVGTVDLLYDWLKPGGFVYGRFASEVDRDRPQHIIHNFQPVFDRFAELGFIEVFRDEWLWGHQVFQKTGTNPLAE